MSQYRRTTQHGVLIRQKRGLIRRWLWFFNRSEEDALTKLLNRQVVAQRELRTVQRAIPRHEKAIEDAKKQLTANGGTSPVWYESWMPKATPVKRTLPGDKPTKKKADPPKESTPLFEIHQGNKKK